MIARPDQTDHSINTSPNSRLAKLRSLLEKARLPLLFVGHTLVFVLIYWFALLVRFERLFPENPRHLNVLPLVVVVKLSMFWAFQTFHGWWRYVTFTDLVLLAKATFASVCVFLLLDYLFIPEQISRGAIFIDGAFTVAIMSALRSAWRVWDERALFSNPANNIKRALIIGDDFETAKLAHLINSRHSMESRIMGLVSVEAVAPKRYTELRVVGSLENICELCKDMRIESIYVPAGKLPARQLRSLIDSVQEAGVQVNVVPSLMSLLEGGTDIPIREVSFEDLLRRDPVQLDTDKISEMLAGKRILVTGAGGSIGSELCRQILKFGPKQLLLLGRGENRIYHIEKELTPEAGPTDVRMVLASITDKRRIENIFNTHRPEVVFHAAAHKHVPLTELNVGEAVINNVYGTKVVADACHEYGVTQFVMVSTDKAVNPTSVMGCTKQLAERYCLALGSRSDTKYVVTRFGNVLGSAGSVVPLFKKQIQKGGPLTVTDPRMTRFFMTIPEASQLVVQAGSMGEGGEIFVLEMGEPVKIVDLAHDLIRLAGLPAGSIDVEFTGIRPGAKLYEELYYRDEKSLPTEHGKILTAFHRPFEYDKTSSSLEDLIEAAYSNPKSIRAKLEQLIPEFHRTPASTSDPTVIEVEEAGHHWPQDFKPKVSTSSTTRTDSKKAVAHQSHDNPTAE